MADTITPEELATLTRLRREAKRANLEGRRTQLALETGVTVVAEAHNVEPEQIGSDGSIHPLGPRG